MSVFYQSVRNITTKLILLSLPLVVLVFILYLPNEYFWFEQESMQVLAKLGITIIIAVIELILVLKYLLPDLVKAFSSLFLASEDMPDYEIREDTARIMMKEGRLDDALEMLERYTREQRGTLRSWILRSDFLANDLQRYEEAIDVLEEGLKSSRWNKQDKAFFLYRIGHIYADKLDNIPKAETYWEKAVKKYPQTSYGREAAKRLTRKQ